MSRIAVVVPNLNGEDSLSDCLDSLLNQTVKAHIIVVDNCSVDNSLFLLKKYPEVEVIEQPRNLGFAGGVNVGFKKAIDDNFDYLATLNNDAVADKNWLGELVNVLNSNGDVGIVTSKILTIDGKKIDSTGDYYTVWGLPYPRGRGESDINKYNGQTDIFAASGGASIYRARMLSEIGLFDEDFFAYYEDVDLSFRAQLAGWKVKFAPEAIAYHKISATSSKIKGFASYQTMKNLPLLLFKNVPARYLYSVGWRFTITHFLFFFRAVSRGQGLIAIKGDIKGTVILITGFSKRRLVQKSKKVSDEYIWNCIVHDLPPNATVLRSLRSKWWRLINKHE